MTGNMQIATTVLGGLALFIYGMGLMSEGLTQIAGARMKAILGYVTKNRVAAIAAGAGITALIQSSSATTVMTVGFVNAGLLSLTQAIGVVFGANIGTTVTGQLVSLKVTDLALPAVVLGVVGLMAARRSMMRGVCRTVLGFGLLFFGMNMMSDELKSLAKLPEFVSFFSYFDCAPSAGGYLPVGAVLGAIAVGTLCTVAVQSSSATIGITIALANAGVINLWTAVPIVLGDNIGTTVTALLASIGTNVNARRAALAHALFNIIGTMLLVMTFVLVFAEGGVRAPAFFHLVNACAEGNAFLGENPGRHVAMAHSLFNVMNVVVLAFFIPRLAQLCSRLIRDNSNQKVQSLEPLLLANPALALVAARRTLGEMARRASTVASVALNTCLGRAHVAEEAVQDAEREIDGLQTNLRDYLVALSQRKLTERQAQALPEMLHCVNDAERISDIALKIFRKASRVQREGLSDEILQQTNDLMSEMRSMAVGIVHALRSGEALAFDPEASGKRIVGMARDLTRKFADRLRDFPGDTPHDMAFLTVMSAVKDVARHLANIAERIEAERI